MFSISLIIGGIENICSGREFRSDLLAEMAGYITDEWPEADSVLTLSHGKRAVTARVADGRVEHIGYRIFPDEVRARLLNPLVADFVERYWLTLTLPLQRQKSVAQQLLEDRFTFTAGSPLSVDRIQSDTALVFSCEISPAIVSMTWGNKEKPVCAITFPVNHELILGRRMPENDRRLPDEINSARIPASEPRNLAHDNALPSDTLTSLVVENAGSYIDCALKSERYYIQAPDATLQPVFDSSRPAESIANIFTGCDIPQAAAISFSINHKIFGLREQTIETTLQKFVAYALREGCTPYVGVISLGTGTSPVADVLVIMHNRHAGYNHVLRASVPLNALTAGAGKVTARLNAFVPSSNIKNLFKN